MLFQIVLTHCMQILKECAINSSTTTTTSVERTMDCSADYTGAESSLHLSTLDTTREIFLLQKSSTSTSTVAHKESANNEDTKNARQSDTFECNTDGRYLSHKTTKKLMKENSPRALKKKRMKKKST